MTMYYICDSLKYQQGFVALWKKKYLDEHNGIETCEYIYVTFER
jgi:hypothetical protein